VWRVRALEAPRVMVLHSRRNPVTGREVEPGSAGAFLEASWVFLLSEIDPGRTRLQVRVRAAFRGRIWIAPVARAARILFGVGDSVMENSMLAGIRARAERQTHL
jgi:hypothetical protein